MSLLKQLRMTPLKTSELRRVVLTLTCNCQVRHKSDQEEFFFCAQRVTSTQLPAVGAAVLYKACSHLGTTCSGSEPQIRPVTLSLLRTRSEMPKAQNSFRARTPIPHPPGNDRSSPARNRKRISTLARDVKPKTIPHLPRLGQ